MNGWRCRNQREGSIERCVTQAALSSGMPCSGARRRVATSGVDLGASRRETMTGNK